MLTRQQWNNLTEEDQKEWINERTYGKHFSSGKPSNPCKPGFVVGLYSFTPIPCIYVDDENFIEVNPHNISEGLLKEQGLVFKWFGYVSILYDGQLQLSPIKTDSFCTLVFEDGRESRWENGNLIKGDWPGFLCIAS